MFSCFFWGGGAFFLKSALNEVSHLKYKYFVWKTVFTFHPKILDFKIMFRKSEIEISFYYNISQISTNNKGFIRSENLGANMTLRNLQIHIESCG